MSRYICTARELDRAKFAAFDTALTTKGIAWQYFEISGGGRVYKTDDAGLVLLDELTVAWNKLKVRGLVIDDSTFVFQLANDGHVKMISGLNEDDVVWLSPV